jgi:hypothetical protein
MQEIVFCEEKGERVTGHPEGQGEKGGYRTKKRRL